MYDWHWFKHGCFCGKYCERHSHKKTSFASLCFYPCFLLWLFSGFDAFVRMVGRQLFQELISAFDHWIAFLLLGFIGVHMLKESLSNKEEEVDDSLSFKTILLLAIATSIDLGCRYQFCFFEGRYPAGNHNDWYHYLCSFIPCCYHR